MTGKAILAEFETNTRELIPVLSDLDQKQLNTIPYEGSLTAGPVGDHMLKSYSVVKTLNGLTGRPTRPADQYIDKV